MFGLFDFFRSSNEGLVESSEISASEAQKEKLVLACVNDYKSNSKNPTNVEQLSFKLFLGDVFKIEPLKVEEGPKAQLLAQKAAALRKKIERFCEEKGKIDEANIKYHGLFSEFDEDPSFLVDLLVISSHKCESDCEACDDVKFVAAFRDELINKAKEIYKMYAEAGHKRECDFIFHAMIVKPFIKLIDYESNSKYLCFEDFTNHIRSARSKLRACSLGYLNGFRGDFKKEIEYASSNGQELQVIIENSEEKLRQAYENDCRIFRKLSEDKANVKVVDLDYKGMEKMEGLSVGEAVGEAVGGGKPLVGDDDSIYHGGKPPLDDDDSIPDYDELERDVEGQGRRLLGKSLPFIPTPLEYTNVEEERNILNEGYGPQKHWSEELKEEKSNRIDMQLEAEEEKRRAEAHSYGLKLSETLDEEISDIDSEIDVLKRRASDEAIDDADDDEIDLGDLSLEFC